MADPTLISGLKTGINTVIDIANKYTGGNIDESMAKQNTSGTPYNIITDYAWTLSPMSNPAISSRVPSIQLYEYQMTKNMLIKSIQYFATNLLNGAGNTAISHYTNAANSKDEAYDALFDYNSATNYNYVFPYYNEENINAINTWGGVGVTEKISELANIASPELGGLIDKGMAAYTIAQSLRYPNVGSLDKPMMWTGAEPRSFKITFFLYNTLSYDDIQKNWDLCNLLYYQNSYAKITMMNSYPPVFYMVIIPGQYSSPGAYMTNFTVRNVGNIRSMRMSNGITANIPDAYEVNMELKDMVMPSRNILNRTYNGPIVTTSTQVANSPLQPAGNITTPKTISSPYMGATTTSTTPNPFSAYTY